MHDFLKGLLEIFGDVLRDVCTDSLTEKFGKRKTKNP